MSTNATHTPTPWKVGGQKATVWSTGEIQDEIANFRPFFAMPEEPAASNAAFAVLCVNSHDALLAACRAAKLAFASWHGSGCRCDVCKQLNEAVKLADGQG